MIEIIIHEVGMRDGLQVELETIPTKRKIEWIEKLITSGIDIIQVGSFVNPKKVPPMADTDELFKHFSNNDKKNRNVILSALVLNEKGLDRALACDVDMICMGVSASETHSMKNVGTGTEEALTKILKMAKSASDAKKKIQVSVQSAFGCGYEGIIPESKVLNIVKRYIDEGFTNISLADTAGLAYPAQVEKMFSSIMSVNSEVQLVCHFHDTYGLGIVNCYAAFKTGVKYYESSFAGLGGCPFTAIASGNVCTEELIHMFKMMNLRNDIDITKICEVSLDAENFFKRELPGKIHKRIRKD